MITPANSSQPITDNPQQRYRENAAGVMALTCIVEPAALFGLLWYGFFWAALAVGVFAFLIGVVAGVVIWDNDPEEIARRAKEEAAHEKRLADLAEQTIAAQKAAAEHRARRQTATPASETPATETGDPIIEQMKRHYAETVARHAALKEIKEQIVKEYGVEKNAWPQHVRDMLQDLEELIAAGDVPSTPGSPWAHR